jgi:hypothetical protein
MRRLLILLKIIGRLIDLELAILGILLIESRGLVAAIVDMGNVVLLG